jgi:NADPH:quinone reductase-like Zn-dependent oxidoreductase
MRAAIRKGILGYTVSFSNNQAIPAFEPETKNINDVFVKVNAAAINPVDYKLPRAASGPVYGNDFCGTIEQIGKETSGEFQVGDVVFGIGTGSVAEYAVANSGKIAKAPSTWKYSEYAALPIAYMSSLQCLRKGGIIDKEGSKQDGKSVLVIGASGGCGIAGLQLCQAVGVSRIVAICSGKNSQLVRNMGANEVIDYTKESELASFFAENAGKFDCVLDAATNSGGGEDYWKTSMALLKRDLMKKLIGHYTALNGPATKWVRALSGYQTPNESIIMMNSNTSDLEQVVSLLDRTGARPLLNSMPFDEKGVLEAFKLLKSRRVKGKIVFEMAK